jgi:hypothetical protein
MKKVRFKGWQYKFEALKVCLDTLIEGTPTSELRNKLCDLNIQVIELEKFSREQKEVE